LRVQRDGRSFTVEVTPDGEGLVSHAGSALLAQVADKTGLTRALSLRLSGMRERRSRHEPGRVVCDLAVMLADGGDCLSDLRAVRDQAPLFGEAASDATAFRLEVKPSDISLTPQSTRLDLPPVPPDSAPATPTTRRRSPVPGPPP
jgi:Transposase DDE domain group 1